MMIGRVRKSPAKIASETRSGEKKTYSLGGRSGDGVLAITVSVQAVGVQTEVSKKEESSVGKRIRNNKNASLFTQSNPAFVTSLKKVLARQI